MAKQVDDHGSLLDLRILVNQRQRLLDDQLIQSGHAASASIEWVSPLEPKSYAEYSDGKFLDAIGRPELRDALSKFWPSGGPVWDGLGLGGDPGHAVFLLEAKAHLPELFSSGTGAGGPSLELIRASMERVQHSLGVRSEMDWTGCFYQYANRLAHLWWLREQGVNAYLVYVYFLNDQSVSKPAPTSRAEWEAAFYVMRKCLGLTSHRLSSFVVDLYFDVNELSP